MSRGLIARGLFGLDCPVTVTGVGHRSDGVAMPLAAMPASSLLIRYTVRFGGGSLGDNGGFAISGEITGYRAVGPSRPFSTQAYGGGLSSLFIIGQRSAQVMRRVGVRNCTGKREEASGQRTIRARKEGPILLRGRRLTVVRSFSTYRDAVSGHPEAIACRSW